MNESAKHRPFLRVTISASNAADDMRLQAALAEIAGQDCSVRVNARENNVAYDLEGTAESDLDLVCDRLRGHYGIAINVGQPEAILIQTIRNQAEGEGKYIRQIGGSGNYGHCKIRIEPAIPGKDYEFINDIRQGSVPDEYIKSIDEGIQAAMRSGILAGVPLANIKVTFSDGSYHETDSNETAFKFAGSIALLDAARKASPVVMEPMMAIALEVPENLAQAVGSEIHSHRGRIEHEETANGFTEIGAIVPLSELLTSSSGLTYAPMEFAGYEQVRDNGSTDDGAAGVIANKPNPPHLGHGSEMARWEPDED